MSEPTPPDAPPTDAIEDRRERARARAEAKNQAVRDQLEPLEPGERPLAVTIAAVAAMLLALGNVLAFIFSNNLSGKEESRAIVQVALIVAVLVAASIGMWRTKYWAVLGFQTILGLQIIVYSLALTRVERWTSALLLITIVIASGVLFWFLIRAMARIQMPESPEMKKLREREEAAAEQEGETDD